MNQYDAQSKMKKEAIYLPNMNFVDISGVPFEGICLMSIVLGCSWRILDSFSLSVAFLKVAAARSQVEEAYSFVVNWFHGRDGHQPNSRVLNPL